METAIVHGLRRLDVMVAYSCNLACRGCISLSDFRRSGVEPRENLKQMLKHWSGILDPEVVTVFGGEPTLHPDLDLVCMDLRRAWPRARLRLITNGLLLSRFDAGIWYDLTPFEMQISVHRTEHESKINQAVREILSLAHPWSVEVRGGHNEHIQTVWHRPGFDIWKSKFGEFVEPYRRQDQKIVSWNSDPAKAHAICGAPDTPVLFRDRLYKCPAVANVADVVPGWPSQGLGPGDDLTDFIANIGRPESVCAQCPDTTTAVRINHLDPVNVVER